MSSAFAAVGCRHRQREEVALQPGGDAPFRAARLESPGSKRSFPRSAYPHADRVRTKVREVGDEADGVREHSATNPFTRACLPADMARRSTTHWPPKRC